MGWCKQFFHQADTRKFHRRKWTQCKQYSPVVIAIICVCARPGGLEPVKHGVVGRWGRAMGKARKRHAHVWRWVHVPGVGLEEGWEGGPHPSRPSRPWTVGERGWGEALLWGGGVHLLRVVEFEWPRVRHHDGLAGVLGVVQSPLHGTLTLTVTWGGVAPEPVLGLLLVVALTPVLAVILTPLLTLAWGPLWPVCLAATLTVSLVGRVGVFCGRF